MGRALDFSEFAERQTRTTSDKCASTSSHGCETCFTSRLVSSTISLLLVAESFVAATITVGCDTVPVTGCRQVLTISETEENTLGLTAYKEILEKESISKNERYNELVQHVGQKLSAVADRSKFE